MSDIVKIPRFLLIKQYIENHITSGSWPVGTRVPSENDLAVSFSVSRMTARRALKELDDQGFLNRAPGRGSFVAKPQVRAPHIELRNVVQNIQNLGRYSCRIVSLDSIHADMFIAKTMRVNVDDELYKGVFVHLDANKPAQLEEIYVNPSLAPAFIKQNYQKVVADAYLNWVAQPNHTEYQLSAIMPSAAQRRQLELTHEGEGPCIKITKRHWAQELVISLSILINPSDSYHLGVEIT